MTDVRIDKDEMYPYYYIHKSYGGPAKLTLKTIQRVQAAEAEFNACQAILRKAVGDE